MEVGLNTEGSRGHTHTPGPVADRVEYAALDLNAMANRPPTPPVADTHHHLGKKVVEGD